MSLEFRKFFGSLDEQDRIEFLCAPYYAALEVALADGQRDEKETHALWEWQRGQAETVDGDFANAMDQYSVQIIEFRASWLASALEDGQPDAQRVSKLHSDLRSRVQERMKDMPEHLSQSYKRYLMEGLFKVASASGESIFESWEKIDESEIRKIHTLLEEFDVSLMDLLRFVATKNIS